MIGLILFILSEAAPVDYLTAIKEVLPSAKKVGIMCNMMANVDALQKIAQAATQLGLAPFVGNVKALEDVPKAFESLSAQKVDVIWVFPDATLKEAVAKKFILEKATAAKIPIIGYDVDFVKEGAFLTVVKTNEVKYHVNMEVAKTLGITIPDAVKSKIVVEKE